MNANAAPALHGAFISTRNSSATPPWSAICRFSRVLLMNDAGFPWLIAVPRQAGAVELLDLGEAERTQLMGELALLAQVLKDLTGCHKINIAAIGNVVAQLHVHIVARRRDDPLWPRPVWGAQPPRPYAAAERDRLIEGLRRKIGFA